jgi:hypothetical protein
MEPYITKPGTGTPASVAVAALRHQLAVTVVIVGAAVALTAFVADSVGARTAMIGVAAGGAIALTSLWALQRFVAARPFAVRTRPAAHRSHDEVIALVHSRCGSGDAERIRSLLWSAYVDGRGRDQLRVELSRCAAASTATPTEAVVLYDSLSSDLGAPGRRIDTVALSSAAAAYDIDPDVLAPAAAVLGEFWEPLFTLGNRPLPPSHALRR